MINVITLEETQLEEMLRRAATYGASVALENSKAEPVSEIMDKRALAKYLNFSMSKINRLIDKENLPCHKKDGEHPRFFKSEIDSWLKNRL